MMFLSPPRRNHVFGSGQTTINAVVVASGFGMLLLGYDQGVMAGLIGTSGTPFSNTFKDPDATTLGIMVAIYEIGCFFGAMFVFFVGEWLGRRVNMLGGCIVMFAGASLQAGASNMGTLIAGRIITGLGNGVNFSTIPVWASEITGHDERGKMAAFNGWLIIWGVVIAYWADYGCANYTSDLQFRFPIALQILFGFIMFVMVIFLPESPRWLISQGRDKEARDVIEWITPKSTSADATEHDSRVSALFNSIVATREEEKSASDGFSYRELFSGGEMQNWRRMAICCGVMACQQLSGINLLTYYISYVLEHSVGLDHHMSLLMGGFNGLEYLVASAIPFWTIERVGRRKLLLFSAVGQTISMTILAGAIWYVTKNPDGPAYKAMGIVAVFCFFLFNTCYAQGFLAIPFFYPAEMANLRTRARGVAISVMSNWIFTFLVVMITPVCTTNIGWRTYVIFAVLNASFIPVIYFFFPETARLSLEALDKIFDVPGGITRGVLDKAHRRRMLEISLETDNMVSDGEEKQPGRDYKPKVEEQAEFHETVSA